jgi:hypothetical protein
MGNVYQLAGTPVQLTLTFAGLAHDANLLAGRQSTAITLADTVTGLRISGKARTGSSAPTAGSGLFLYWIQKIGDNATEASASWPQGFGDSDANVAILNQATVSQAGTYLGSVEVTAATATDFSFSFDYRRVNFSRVGCLWIAHNWGQLPDATNTNHEFWVEPYSTVY